MRARRRRLLFVVLAILGVGIAAALALDAMRSNISYFFSPSQVAAGEAPADALFRLGGLVVPGSLVRQADGLTRVFAVTDNAATRKVSYTGILPDLFGEGQGVVAKGRLGADGVFYAEEVLAKHDESYLPPEVAASLQPTGVEGDAAGTATGR
ncbi:MAG: cytochrome c maturation protein CcmE [Candidatus Thiosymbion ectosymbiont of Robbea hypermnestra]|nr:cytochrome c maturation protein CcmE [Candidatus Thiosymbion ectosymbiont of Robbea hypermnestra]